MFTSSPKTGVHMSLEKLQLQTAAITDRGLSEKRPQNEDSFLSLPDFGIFAVADGVGGAMGGDVASQMAVEVLGEAFSNFSGSVSPEEILTVAIEKANYSINQMASELPQLAGMASTIVALHLSEDKATVAHVGDSRLYRVNKDGNILQETADHSVVEEAVRAGNMTPEQAAIHPNRNVISRAVGADITIDIEVREIPLEPATSYVLCSDGITRHVSDEEIRDLMMTGMSVEMLCEQLREMCYNRGAEDNLTAVIVKIPKTAEISGNRTAQPDLGAIPSFTVEELAEEETIATARSIQDEVSETPTLETFHEPEPGNDFRDQMISEQNLTDIEQPPSYVPESEGLDDEAYLMEEAAEPFEAAETIDIAEELTAEDEQFAAAFVEPEPEVAAPEYASSRVVVPARSSTDAESEFSMFGEASKAKISPKVSTASAGGSVFRSILFLLLGGVIGAAAFYYGAKYNQPEPVQTVPVQDLTPRSNNIPASTLEELRWNVDKDPEAYLQANVASARDASDHYILGRALFLTGKHFEAKRQFALANEKIATAETNTAATIKAEIAMMNAIIEDAQAAENFKRTFEASQKSLAADASNTTTGSNSAVNGNTNSTP